jgi:hypothetical protein
LLFHFEALWDNKVRMAAQRTINITKFLQPSAGSQEAKSSLESGWLNYKKNLLGSLMSRETF